MLLVEELVAVSAMLLVVALTLGLALHERKAKNNVCQDSE